MEDEMAERAAIRVRLGQRRDIASLVAFNLAMARETEDRALDEQRLEGGVRAVFESLGKGFYVVAELEDHVVGSLLVTFEWSDWRNACFWWIQSVYVSPEFRRRGVYTALHRHVEREARKRSDVCGLRLYVDRDNAAAQQVYARLGMKRSRYLLVERQLLTHRAR
jgi:GNAT superfamily N-acetyltransferase